MRHAMVQATNQKPSTTPASQPPSTGDKRVSSPKSRINNNAVHATPSPPLVPSKVSTPKRKTNSSPSPNNKLLTAPLPSEIKDAKVVSWTTSSNTSQLKVLSRLLTIHTLPNKSLRPSSRTLPLRMSTKQQRRFGCRCCSTTSLDRY